jgi:hypothetical protein
MAQLAENVAVMEAKETENPEPRGLTKGCSLSHIGKLPSTRRGVNEKVASLDLGSSVGSDCACTWRHGECDANAVEQLQVLTQGGKHGRQ